MNTALPFPSSSRLRGLNEINFDLFSQSGFDLFLKKIHLPADTTQQALLRGLLFSAIAWIPLALWSIISGNYRIADQRLVFFNDFSAYAQFWIGLPLLTIAQAIIGRRISTSTEHFAASGLVIESEMPAYQAILRTSEKAAKSRLVEVLALIGAYGITWAWLTSEMATGVTAWYIHTMDASSRLTPAGVWEGIVAIPLFWFLIMRWIWRIFVWSVTLLKISRLRLDLRASHPDRMGGLRFISIVQSYFGIIIFVFGCVIASTALYKIMIQRAPMTAYGVWTMIVGFGLLSPIAFVAPLLVFTPTLLRLRMRGQYEFGALGTRYSKRFEDKWIHEQFGFGEEFLGTSDIQSLADIGNAYDRTMALRIIPFDMGSIFRLAGAAIGPMIPVIIKILPQNNPFIKIINTILR